MLYEDCNSMMLVLLNRFTILSDKELFVSGWAYWNFGRQYKNWMDQKIAVPSFIFPYVYVTL